MLSNIRQATALAWRPKANQSGGYLTKKYEESKAQEISETCAEEIECQMCLILMVEPLRTPCGCILCANCANLFLLDQKECPVDRKKISGNQISQVDKFLQEQYEVELEIGNYHREVSEYYTSWTCFIQATSPLIAKYLHNLIYKAKFEVKDTYYNTVNFVSCEEDSPLTLTGGGNSRDGKDIIITIYFCLETGKIEPFTFNWTISFADRPKTKKLTFQFDWLKIQPLLSDDRNDDQFVY